MRRGIARCAAAASSPPLSSQLLDIVAAATAARGGGEDAAAVHHVTFAEMLRTPHVPPPSSLPFLPPPRWAAELSRQLQRAFPELHAHEHGVDAASSSSSCHLVRYIQAFVHPSFTTAAGASATMQSLAPLGEAWLQHALSRWLAATFATLRRAEASALLTLLGGDAALSAVLRHAWQLDHMVLTDAVAELFSRERVSSTRGLVQWLASNGTQSLPEPYAADCVKAVLGVVVLEHGHDTATRFCHERILPHVDLHAAL